MKTVTFRTMLAAIVTVLALAILMPVHVQGQVDKVKEKAKDLKKELEGQSKTNKPPQKTPPPPPK